MKVSVCIPTFNQAPYIEQAVRSAHDQTFKPSEIIVYDDCSTDETPQILAKLASEIVELKIFRQPQNVGISGNVDACLRAATSDFVVRLDSDDRLCPTYIEKLSTALNSYPYAGYAHGAIQEIDKNNLFLKERRLYRKTGYVHADAALKDAVKGYRVAANLIMFRKSALIAVDYLKGRPNFGEDYHLASAIAAAGFGNTYCNEILGWYRVWVDNGMVRQKRKLAEINGIRAVFEDVLHPAFNKRMWSTNELKYNRKKFAINQSDCLSWSIYSPNEKDELANELFKLSSAPTVKLFAWMYSNKTGIILKTYKNIQTVAKSMVKKLVVTLRAIKVK